MGEVLRIKIETDADISRARRLGRELAATLPFTTTDLTAIDTATAELARNIISFAKHGEIRITVLERNERQGLQIVAQDTGPGILDPSLAMTEGYSTSGRLGLGLSGVMRLVDEFDITSHVGVGTSVTARKWAR